MKLGREGGCYLGVNEGIGRGKKQLSFGGHRVIATYYNLFHSCIVAVMSHPIYLA